MGLSKVEEKKLETLKTRLGRLLNEYVSANDQYDKTLDAVLKAKLSHQIKDLTDECQKIESEIKELECDSNYPNKKIRSYLDQHLSKIDFQDARDVFYSVRSTLHQFNAVLLLVQNSHDMKGQLFIREIHKELNGVYKEDQVRHCRFELEAKHLNRISFLNRIISILCPTLGAKSVQADTQNIFDFILKNLRSSELNRRERVLFIEFTISGLAQCLNPDFFDWFIGDFWCPLLEKAKAEPAPGLFKVVFLVEVRKRFPKNKLAPGHWCRSNNPNPSKFVELPLVCWRIEDIEGWLRQYSGLDDDSITQLSQSIYEESGGGRPVDVYTAITDRFRFETGGF